MMKAIILSIALVLVALHPAPGAAAQPQSTPPPKAELPKGEQGFIMTAAQGNMLEIALGRVAMTKASNDEVKQFAERMVNDHSEANNALAAIAKMKGITLPKDMDEKHKKEYDSVEKTSSKNFDAVYMNAMVKDHQTTVAEFENKKRDVSDPDLKAFVERNLAILQKHLIMAQNLDAKLKSGKTPK